MGRLGCWGGNLKNCSHESDRWNSLLAIASSLKIAFGRFHATPLQEYPPSDDKG
jgi:hypothetical protein